MLDLVPAAPQRHGPLTIFPLTAAGARDLSYTLLADALAAGSLHLTELGSGSVPELLAVNEGDADVLVLDGEQLVGAKQNRTTSRSIVLPARTKTVTPVSCMERGRWRAVSREMSPAPHHAPARVRRRARAVEAAYVKEKKAAAAHVLAEAQGEVWQEIAVLSDKLGAGSPTGALDEIFRAKAFDLDEWAKSFPLVDGQVGILAFAVARPLGLDVLAGPNLYPRVHDRLVRGYALDALGGAWMGKGEPGEREAKEFLAVVRDAPRAEAPTVGRGTYRVLGDGVLGGELEDEGRLVHLSAFAA